MPSSLHQIQLGYDQLQDRLVLSLSTQDFNEYRFWITRHAVKGFWNILVQLLQADEKTKVEQNRLGAQISNQIEKEKSERRPSADKYSTSMLQRPFGNDPVLIYKIMGKPRDPSGFYLHLEDNQGHSIEFGGDSTILLALCELIQKTVEKADWGLHFQLGQPGQK